jgi:hypothetical protein
MLNLEWNQQNRSSGTLAKMIGLRVLSLQKLGNHPLCVFKVWIWISKFYAAINIFFPVP